MEADLEDGVTAVQPLDLSGIIRVWAILLALAVVSGCTLDADGTPPRSLGPDVGLLSG